MTASAKHLAASLLWSLAALQGLAAERWVLDVEDWTCGSYDTSADDLTLDGCVSNCAGYAYMAYWWGGQQEGHCGCTDHCEVGAATSVSSNEHNMLYKSATARSTHQDTWGVYRKDWSCASYDTEAVGLLDLQECLGLCGAAGYNYTQHWWGGLNQGRCRCGSTCDAASATDTGNNEHNAVYKMASAIQETWALVKDDWKCDAQDRSLLYLPLEACTEYCGGHLSMSHRESNDLCRCSDSCYGGKPVDVAGGYTNKVYRVIPLQTTWVEYKANYECKQFYSLRAFAARKDLASCLEHCSSHPFLIHRSYGSSGLGSCQCLSSCDSPRALSSRSTQTTLVYKSVPIQMLYPSR